MGAVVIYCEVLLVLLITEAMWGLTSEGYFTGDEVRQGFPCCKYSY